MHTTTSTRTRSTTSTFTASNAGIGAINTAARKSATAEALDTPDPIKDTETGLTIRVTAESMVAAGITLHPTMEAEATMGRAADMKNISTRAYLNTRHTTIRLTRTDVAHGRVNTQESKSRPAILVNSHKLCGQPNVLVGSLS